MENHNNNRRLISIGELSELYSISRRSLRIYHDVGLLVPEYVDEKTGYRYYTSRQFPQLETILQMKALGLSLNNILVLLEKRDLNICESILGERLDELNSEIASLMIARNSLLRQINSCKLLRNPPVYNRIGVEYMPERGALMFDIKPFNFLDSIPGRSAWSDALDLVRTTLVEKGVSLACFQKIGCLVTKEELLKAGTLCTGAFIVDDSLDKSLPWYTIIPSGTYICAYRTYIAMDGHYESACMHELLDYIEENGYEIVGPYLGEVIAESSLFACNDRNIMLRQQIQVRHKHNK